MARLQKEKAFDEKRITESRKMEFLYWQYAKRKFYFDCTHNVIDITEWRKNYFELFRAVVKRYCKDYIDVNGVILNMEVALSESGVYKFHCTAPDFIFSRLNEIITVYHNSINDNPEFSFDFIRMFECSILDEERNSESYIEFVSAIINKYSDELLYIRDVCIRYGYYPRDLMAMRNAIKDYKLLCCDKLNAPESFICLEKYSDIVRVHFVSSSGQCYFENHKEGFVYVYCDIYSGIDVSSVVADVKIRLSRKGKKNFSDEIRYSDAPNMQLCICMNNKSELKEIVDEVRYALLIAMNYFIPYKHSYSREIQDVQWRVLHAKYKKISYLRRFVGLFIWDIVHFNGFKLSDIIILLIEMAKDCTCKPSHKIKLPESIIEETRLWGKLLSESINDGLVLETSSLDREYRLAEQSIQSMSICQHISGNVNN